MMERDLSTLPPDFHRERRYVENAELQFSWEFSTAIRCRSQIKV
jgi:hypothetical protein